MKVALIEMRYPYGKNRIYLNGSQYVVGARLMELDHEVDFVDLNMDKVAHQHIQAQFKKADIIGISVIGSPYIPDAIRLTNTLNRLVPTTPIMLGGQVISNLLPEQFDTIFAGVSAVQIVSDFELARMLECNVNALQSVNPYQISYVPFLESLNEQRLKRYMNTEITLVISQGCAFNCTFCAAEKDQKEVHVEIDHFESLLKFFAKKAIQFGMTSLQFYASSLDFFQHPSIVAPYLELMARVQEETGVRFKMRALTCLTSFLSANRIIPNLKELIQGSGLNSVGFGVDGTDEEIWSSQNKRHDNLSSVDLCIRICSSLRIETQILLVMGYKKENWHTLWKTCKKSKEYVRLSPRVVIRPFIAKEFVPGNDGWYNQDLQKTVRSVVSNPDLFYNLDFAACASSLTHPRRKHRIMCNAAYLGIILYHKLHGRCPNSPLFPQGSKGISGFLAKILNRLLPITD